MGYKINTILYIILTSMDLCTNTLFYTKENEIFSLNLISLHSDLASLNKHINMQYIAQGYISVCLPLENVGLIKSQKRGD